MPDRRNAVRVFVTLAISALEVEMHALFRLAAISAVVACVVACENDPTFEKRVAIHYIPFGIATAVPVTRDNIEAMAFRSGLPVRGSATFRELEGRLNAGASCVFEEKAVRAKIVLPDDVRVVFIDNEGCVDLSGAATRQVNVDRIRYHLWNMTSCPMGEDACRGIGP